MKAVAYINRILMTALIALSLAVGFTPASHALPSSSASHRIGAPVFGGKDGNETHGNSKDGNETHGRAKDGNETHG